MQEFTGTAKLALRDQLLDRPQAPRAGRRRRPRAGRSPSTCWPAPEVRRAATVAAYVSVSTEPGTGPLLEALRAAGKRVILPLVQPDFDLDWARTTTRPACTPHAAGCSSRPVAALGADAVATADAVLVPGLAVGARRHPARQGRRLLRPGPGPGPRRDVHLRAAQQRGGPRPRPRRRPRPLASPPSRPSSASPASRGPCNATFVPLTGRLRTSAPAPVRSGRPPAGQGATRALCPLA